MIEFITTGKGTNPVRFISNAEVYAIFSQIFAFGSHTLLSYIGIDDSVNIVMCFGVKICWLWFLPLAALAAAIFLHSKYNKEYENCSRELTTNISNTKINVLNKALRENGFDELNSFEAGRAQVNSIPSIKKPKSFKTRAIWCSVLTGILIIASLINGSIVSRNNLHSPKQLNITISSISHEYKEKPAFRN